jgi:elongation factor G
VAFIAAARKATLLAMREARPIVLEPLVNIEVISPESAMGDLTGDLAAKRGHITGSQARGGGTVSISGQMPLAELGDYQSRLKSLTGGQGSYSLVFSHYAPVSPETQQRLASAFKPQLDDE